MLVRANHERDGQMFSGMGVYEGMGAEPVLGGPCPAGTMGIAYPACFPVPGGQPGEQPPVLGGPCPAGTTGIAYPACVPNGMIPSTPVTPGPPNPSQPPPINPAPPPPLPSTSAGPNWLLIGGVGVAVVGLGAFLLMSKKQPAVANKRRSRRRSS